MGEVYYQDKDCVLWNGDARVVLAELPKDSVDCVVTSPPYWSLRAYAGIEPLLFGGDAECQHGMEPSGDAPVNLGGQPGVTARVGNTKAGVQRPYTEEELQYGWVRDEDMADIDPDLLSAFREADRAKTKLAVGGNSTGVYGGGIVDPGKVHARADAPGPGQTCTLCGAWLGHFGLEATPQMYIEHSMEFLDAIWRVLKPTGTVWINIDDSRIGSNNGSNDYRPDGASISQNKKKYQGQKTGTPPGLKPTSLALIPERFAIAAQERGWIIESVIIWEKPDAMPESVKRRPTDSHEYIFMLAKSNKWRFYQDAVREPHKAESLARYQRNSRYDQPMMKNTPYAMQQGPRGHGVTKYDGEDPSMGGNGNGFVGHSGYTKANGEPLVNEAGRNVRTVWTFPTEAGPTGPQGERHFAGFPEELVERCLTAGCPERVCAECGVPWEPIVERSPGQGKLTPGTVAAHQARGGTGIPSGTVGKAGSSRKDASSRVLGQQPACKHSAAWIPGTVLDPFAGSGTTLLVAKKMGRKSIGVELSPSYCEIAVHRGLRQQSLL